MPEELRCRYPKSRIVLPLKAGVLVLVSTKELLPAGKDLFLKAYRQGKFGPFFLLISLTKI